MLNALSAESIRPLTLNQDFPHGQRPDRWSHFGWTTPNSAQRPIRYKYVIQQSHTNIIELCHRISWLPLKKTSQSVREYLLEVVCRVGGGGSNCMKQSMRDHFQTYVRTYERAVFGGDNMSHTDWHHFNSNYNYLCATLQVLQKQNDHGRL